MRERGITSHWGRRQYLQLGLIAAILIAGGCAAQPVPKPTVVNPALVGRNGYADLKAAYLKANPDARVGRVAAVLANQNRAAIEDIPTGDFAVGDDLIIVDENFDIIADAAVTDAGTDLLFVRFTQPSGGRDPVVGDLAIRPEPPDRPTAAK